MIHPLSFTLSGCRIVVLEVALLDVIPGKESQFETAFGEAQGIISSMKGYIDHQLKRCIEKPSRYILLVDWETLEDHTKGFRSSREYRQWQKLLHDYYEPFPQIEHYESVLPGNPA